MSATILIVDSEESIREVVIMMLASEGYSVLEAESGVQALELLASGQHVDLILSEVMMARMDGIALLEHVIANYPKVPLVFQAGCHDAAVERAALRLGAKDYIRKPFTRELLLEVVKRELACGSQDNSSEDMKGER